MDYDRDGRVSFSDFSQTVNKEPLMMEAFGTCLPTNKPGLDFKKDFGNEPKYRN